MKPTPQQHRSRATVERLLAAANEEFAQHGVNASTTTSIAERAGVSVGSLYRFYTDKSALASALAEQYLQAATKSYGPILADIDTTADLVPAIRRIVHAAAELQVDHAGYYRITEESSPDSADSPASEVRNTLVEFFASVLDELDVGPSPEVRRRVISLITETVRHTLALTNPDPIETANRIVELEELAVGYFIHRLGVG
jgi:AcrR family transcriptional regulator